MTRINFLRPGLGRRRSDGLAGSDRRVMLACGAMPLVTCAFVAAWGWLTAHEASAVERDLAIVRRHDSDERNRVAEADHLRRLAIDLQAVASVTDRWRGLQGLSLHVLEAITSALPADCWITAFTFDAEAGVRVEGRASVLDSAFALAESLDKSRRFPGGVHMMETHTGRQARETEDVVAFVLRAEFKQQFPSSANARPGSGRGSSAPR